MAKTLTELKEIYSLKNEENENIFKFTQPGALLKITKRIALQDSKTRRAKIIKEGECLLLLGLWFYPVNNFKLVTQKEMKIYSSMSKEIFFRIVFKTRFVGVKFLHGNNIVSIGWNTLSTKEIYKLVSWLNQHMIPVR